MKPLLTAQQVAEVLGVTTDYIYAETRAGRIPHVKLGRYRRYREEAVEAWIADLEASSVVPKIKRRGAAGTAPGMAQEEVTS